MRSSAITLQPRYKRGRRGEDLVSAWLSQRGYQILAANFRRKSLELDLVASKGRQLLIIEVKTRRTKVDDWQQLIPPRKILALWRGSARFLWEHPEYCDFTVHLGLALVLEAGDPSITWIRLPTEPEI
jgi:Holliday junction resolvase-like predicted endonuclease